MKRSVFSLCLISLLMACGNREAVSEEKPEWLLSEDKMVDVLVDLRIVDAAAYINTNSFPRDKAVDWMFVMKKHHVEDSIFRKSHDYYAEHPEISVKLYERVIDRISEIQADNAEGQ